MLICWIEMLLQDTNHLPLQKSARNQGANQIISVQNEMSFFGIAMGSRTQRNINSSVTLQRKIN
jgi:hypothetical protein